MPLSGLYFIIFDFDFVRRTITLRQIMSTMRNSEELIVEQKGHANRFPYKYLHRGATSDVVYCSTHADLDFNRR